MCLKGESGVDVRGVDARGVDARGVDVRVGAAHAAALILCASLAC